MQMINILIKPASSKCNLKCKYCFYHEITDNRMIKDYGLLKEKVMHQIVDKAFSIDGIKQVNFAFQGGEPLIWGVDNFKKFINYVKEKKGSIKITYAVQTNSILLNDEYIKLFKDNNFLLGISLDGKLSIHDKERIDYQNNGTHKIVVDKIKKLQEAKVAFNVLTVVTTKNVSKIKQTYDYIKDLGVDHIQFIPFVNPDDLKDPYALTAKDFSMYLNETHKLWLRDIKEGSRTYIRYFDNLLAAVSGHNQELCQNRIGCSLQFVIEGNGDVYPCDFYTDEKYSLGNISDYNFKELFESHNAQEFIKDSFKLDDKCRDCKYLSLCGGGCKVHAKNINNKYRSVYCNEYIMFFNKFINSLNK